jgi:hypothetical protein
MTSCAAFFFNTRFIEDEPVHNFTEGEVREEKRWRKRSEAKQ